MSDNAAITIIIMMILVPPPLTFLIIGLHLRKKGNKAARILFNLIGLWFVFIGVVFVVGLGVCGGL